MFLDNILFVLNDRRKPCSFALELVRAPRLFCL
nr:MAG TPA: hypothetical protein [Caudoviricetes sp.]